MVFSSITFLLYFLPLFLACYFFSDKRYKNTILLVASILFYAWGAPRFIFVVLATTFADYHLIAWMGKAGTTSKRKLLLTISVSINLGLLFYFKYSGFFIDNLEPVLKLFGIQPNLLTKLVLPIGISFYTFESITYAVDVYRKIHKPLNSFLDYQLYIIMFPKLIAGPIVRYHEIADQITDRSANETLDNRLTGLYRFGLGLAKKVLIANTLGKTADQVFAMGVDNLDTLTCWAGSLAYTFQIYFDFSGYSDMAIGLAKTMGFKLSENFDNPYTSASITEFWRRWHISLGKWMKNYLYIPLGGNRVKTKLRLYFNLWIVFLVSGFWHGASWSFIFWGAYHGFFIILDRGYFGIFLKKIGRLPSVILTFFIVNIGWIFFRMNDIKAAFHFIEKMFSFSYKFSYKPLISFDGEFQFYLFVAFLFSFFTISNYTQKIQNAVYFGNYNNPKHLLVFSVFILLFILSVASITSSDFNPFIYFRF